MKTHKAYNLNETSSTVYQACDGKTSFDALKRENDFTDDLIFMALDQLKSDNLLKDDNSFISPFTGMSRREVIRKVGFASMVALPVIASLVAPTAAMSQSGCSAPANKPNGCPVGSTISTGGTTCAAFSDASKSATCDTFFGSQCASTNAVYAGDCVQGGGNIQYSCVCAA